MLVDIKDLEFRKKLPLFFLNEAGLSLFDAQKLGMLPTIPNLTKYFNAVILKSNEEGLTVGWMENGNIVGLSFADVTINFEFKLESKISQGNFTYVSPAYRKKGIAKSLRLEMLKRLKDSGYKYAMSIIDVSDAAANKSMESFTRNTSPACRLYKICLNDF